MGIAKLTGNVFPEHNGGHDAWWRTYWCDCRGVVGHWSRRGVATRLLQGRANKLCYRRKHRIDCTCRAVELRRWQPESRSLPHTATELNAQWPRNPRGKGEGMIALGIVLILLGLVFPPVHILFSIGVVLLVIGAVLWALGSMGRPVAGRRHYY